MAEEGFLFRPLLPGKRLIFGGLTRFLVCTQTYDGGRITVDTRRPRGNIKSRTSGAVSR